MLCIAVEINFKIWLTRTHTHAVYNRIDKTHFSNPFGNNIMLALMCVLITVISFILGRKKKDKGMQQAMMMAGMAAAGIMGPMALSLIAMMSAKALLLSKIALLLSGIMALKKLFQQQMQGGAKEPESHPPQHWGRSMQLDAHDMAYSGQKQ